MLKSGISSVTTASNKVAKSIDNTKKAVTKAAGDSVQRLTEMAAGERLPWKFERDKSWDLFNFNYANGGSVEKRKVLWERKKTYQRKGSAQADSAAVLQCNDCYAYMGAGFEFEMVIKATSGAIPIGLDRE
jgi:hypothetical protein